MRRFVRVESLAEQRRALGVSREWLAEQAGVSVKTLQRIEQGSKSGTLPTVCRLVRCLGEMTIRIGRDHYRIRRALPDEPADDVTFEEFAVGLAHVARYLGCGDLPIHDLGYAHLATAAEAAEAQAAIGAAQKFLGQLYATPEIEEQEAQLLREVVLDTIKPALSILMAYARLHGAWLAEFVRRDQMTEGVSVPA